MRKTVPAAVLLLLVVALTFAAKPEDAGQTTTNMTYGQCVSAAAALKNTCYSDVRATKSACLDAANETSAERTCKADYKRDKKTCKNDFKSAKGVCAREYKPGAFARMGSAFK